jgi:hypothetical protein
VLGSWTAKSTSDVLSAPTPLQKAMADCVALAKRDIPHFYLATNIGADVVVLRELMSLIQPRRRLRTYSSQRSFARCVPLLP